MHRHLACATLVIALFGVLVGLNLVQALSKARFANSRFESHSAADRDHPSASYRSAMPYPLAKAYLQDVIQQAEKQLHQLDVAERSAKVNHRSQSTHLQSSSKRNHKMRTLGEDNKLEKAATSKGRAKAERLSAQELEHALEAAQHLINKRLGVLYLDDSYQIDKQSVKAGRKVESNGVDYRLRFKVHSTKNGTEVLNCFAKFANCSSCSLSALNCADPKGTKSFQFQNENFHYSSVNDASNKEAQSDIDSKTKSS